MKKTTVELYVGFFVIIGLVCCAYIVVQLGGLRINQGDQYTLNAFFGSVAGLKPGADVEMAGVAVGQVASISLDRERFVAKVEISLDKKILLSEDVIASVKTSGIIGDKYINLSPGGSETTLSPGGTIFHTESALDLESLVSKYIFSGKE
ncbi:ABC-type transporter involved in resistance to organic solvents, periplasmic binding component [Desulforapulum autotrophicum HRM2]|uniref:ABC-type transporter involved in resistance to organic solvents, periplasmic binding component n=1 Tax=Desulforapulum autotrophicum (strain ATCC 43914 / DSM 3382 / VKM B-1955 / HRM2) TaxID=177437 RepID=C0QDN4_DESAH|nr:outer membrane lipid asymmetry maintenance protein MlaD [Desulforapulum autotrophicum]ACN15298.1 ABC-type transporter involved in resistance to organic solvents, periplasmic binding component [Desulforapulum autotrophicum HRM2]